MSLSILPPELLRLILNGSNSWAAIELWKAGDRTLSAKLVNYGVTDVELVDNRPDSTSRWPTCLTCFKLERLSITRRDGPFYPPDALRRQLEHLHRGLKTLQLYILDIESVLLGPSEQAGTPEEVQVSLDFPTQADEIGFKPASKRLKFETSTEIPTSQHHQLAWDLGTTWPSMELLELGSSMRVDFLAPRSAAFHYGPRVIALLPRSLTSLALLNCQIRPVDLLPPNLQTLSTFAKSLDVEDLPLLPTSITDSGRSISDDGLQRLLEDPQLLPNLRRFSDDRESHTFNLLAAVQGGLPWPADWTELRAPGTPAAVPPTLTSLSWSQSDFSFKSLSLPRGLTHLELPKIDWDEVQLSVWPSTLTYIAIDLGYFNVHWLELLPRGLIKLYIAIDDYRAPRRPNNKKIGFESLCNAGRASLQSDLALWTSMKDHMLKNSTSANLEAVNAYIKSVESGRLYGLPLTLTSLKVPSLTAPNGIDCVLSIKKLLLPPKLTTLRLAEIDCLNNPTLFGSFSPTSSIQFTVDNPQSLLDTFHCNPASSTLYRAASLTWLTIYNRRDRPGPIGSVFQYLPRTLLKLEILDMWTMKDTFGCWTMCAEDLEQLPPNLTLFAFYGLFIESPPKWVHRLPRTLESLVVPHLLITGAEIKDLPRNLGHLGCSLFEASLPQILDLPRSLATFTVRNCLKHPSTSDRHALASRAVYLLIRAFRPFWRVWEAGLVGLHVELSIEAHTWLGSRAARVGNFQSDEPLGAVNSSFPATEEPSTSQKGTYTDPTSDSFYDYTNAIVDRYLVDSDQDSLSIDPRTSRRIARYL